MSLSGDRLAARYNDLREGRLPPPRPFDREALGTLLELALGLSAWKAHGGSRWALRCNPSSGNLHPTEGYVLWPGGGALAPGLYHYASREHALERRARYPAAWREAGGFAVGLASIHWREAWKYGMRAWRYCQHDCGHAAAALAYAAAALGWPARPIAAGDDEVAALLGLDRDQDFDGAEREAPDLLLWLGDPARTPEAPALVERLRPTAWEGRANRLSARHVDWPDIGAVHDATRRPAGVPVHEEGVGPEAPRAASPPALDLPFATLARRRRSAVDFDGVTAIGADAFHTLLDALLPRSGTPPWNALAAPAQVHAALMVHRVRGVEPGLYLLVREPRALPRLRAAMRPEWLWRKCGPEALPLYLLLPHDLRAVARTVSCHQDIAADSCFALGMLAPMAATASAPWRYRELHWECGMLGHALYLEAEAAGVRATGIGCFFDDEMHRLLGLRDAEWQSLYHFTAGGAVDDPRLQTLPPYG